MTFTDSPGSSDSESNDWIESESDESNDEMSPENAAIEESNTNVDDSYENTMRRLGKDKEETGVEAPPPVKGTGAINMVPHLTDHMKFGNLPDEISVNSFLLITYIFHKRESSSRSVICRENELTNQSDDYTYKYYSFAY